MSFFKKILFFFAISLFVFYLIMIMRVDSDILLYKEYATNLVDGNLPYFNNFYIEYPFLIVFFLAIPKLLELLSGSYFFNFYIMTLFFSMASIYISLKLMKLLVVNITRKKLIKIVFFEALFFIILIFLFLSRYDIIPTFFVLLGLYFYIRGEKQKKDIFKNLAYLIIVIAGFLKLYPFLILPLFFVKELRRKEFKLIIKNIIVSIFTSFFLYIIYI